MNVTACFEGAVLVNGTCVPYPELLPSQWVAGQALCCVLLGVGIILSVLFFVEYLREVDRGASRSPLVWQQWGILCMFVACALMMAFATVDPGFYRANTGGFMSPSWMAGMFSLFLVSACFSSFAVSVLSGFWINLLFVTRARTFLGLSPIATIYVCFIVLYTTAVTVAFLVSMATPPALTPADVNMFVGLIGMMTVVEAIIVLVAGSLVVSRLKRSQRFKSFSESDAKRITQVTIAFVAFSIAQVLCGTGQFIVTFFPAEIAATPETWIWAGVWYPILLYSGAYLLILYALRYRSGNSKLRDKQRSQSSVKLNEMSSK